MTLLLAAAFAVRLLFFQGPFGSDDGTYLGVAHNIACGVWHTNSTYIGALRYGFNIPAGFFLFLFGTNSFTATIWPLFCSLAEIAIVYLFAARIWGRRTAVYAGLILTAIPLHIAIATRIHADSVLSLFVTLAFFMFYLGEETNNKLAFFLSGAAMGLVFWTKENALIALFPFVIYPVVFWRVNKNWLYVVGGGALLLALHLTLMQLIAGNPFHVFKTVFTTILTQPNAGRSVLVDSPLYYLRYLFVDIKHLWIAPFFVIPYFFSAALAKARKYDIPYGGVYVLFWLLSLFFFLTLTPVSWHPLQFVPKQSNYMAIFVAPIAMLSGRIITTLPKYVNASVLALVVFGGFGLGAMEQADWRAFTSNSKAAVDFSNAHPEAWVVGTTNNYNIALVYSTLNSNSKLAERFYRFDSKFANGNPNIEISQNSDEGYLIVDEQTMGWEMPMPKWQYPLACWQEVTRLMPTGFGASKYIVDSIISTAKTLPSSISSKLTPPFQALSQPKQAIVYRVHRANLLCGQSAAEIH